MTDAAFMTSGRRNTGKTEICSVTAAIYVLGILCFVLKSKRRVYILRGRVYKVL